MAGEWIDISISLKTGMVRWPGDPEVRIDRVLNVERGDPCNLSSIAMGSHTGTHMDPPFHYLKGGASLDSMPFDATVGPARVIEIDDSESIKPAELEPHGLARGERILFKTRNSARCWETDAFFEDFVHISLEGARYLVERGVGTVGIDYLSVGGYLSDGDAVHHVLLEAGIWLVEGLNLSAVRPGAYELVCLPIRIQESDGAPARAILRPLAPGGGEIDRGPQGR